MPEKRPWRLKTPSPQAIELARKKGLSPITAQILINRGISDSETAEAFLSPRLSSLLDPMLLKDMDRATDLVGEAIKKREHIAVFGDYDADGLTGSALLINLLSEFDIPLSFYIPNRIYEGYGLNSTAIETLAKKGVKLIITVDCGISNQEEIARAMEMGITVIITDHHQIPDDFAPICPVINPLRPDSLFPYREMAGVGVAFFLAIGIRSTLRDRNLFNNKPEPDLKKYLDLVALGTVADMVPLTGQNRIMVYTGIEVMNHTRWPGIEAMKALSGIRSGKITSGDLAFRLAPRINAAGRMGDALTGLELLTTGSEALAGELAGRLNKLNHLRQETEGNILEEIENSIIPYQNIEDKRTLVFAKEGWHQGVVGIVASRLLERYYRPTLVLSISNGMAVGSGRSIDGFDLYRAMTRLGHLFTRFGGHYHAAGCGLKVQDVEALTKGLEDIARESLDEEAIRPSINIDMEIHLQDLTFETMDEIESLAPFGSGNPEPVLYGGNMEVMTSRVVGEKHLKLRVKQGNQILDAIGFGLGEYHPLGGKRLDMVFTPEIDSWGGYKKIQLRINDLELNGNGTRLAK